MLNTFDLKRRVMGTTDLNEWRYNAENRFGITLALLVYLIVAHFSI